jgi:hypothetical protein
VVAVVALFLAGSSFAGYRQWEYVQHDNRFCTTCHLMRDPFERFGRSAHAKLECHNCHHATLQEEIHQLYAVMVNQQTTIKKHAHVSNEVCGNCHVRGDSTRWRIIANTAGHRVHLESRNPALRGLQCVVCHSVSLHEFAPLDRTCGQSGCHAGVRIALGGMGQVEVHCTTCHNFLGTTPVGLSVDSLGRPLTPRAQQCLGCHTMQQRVRAMEIGSDPHRGVCGDCHNPHTQTQAQQVSCTNGTCHANWRTVSFHVGVPHPERCTVCHVPHSWRAEGANCVRCHANVEREPPSRRGAPPRRTDEEEAVQVASASNAVVAALLQGAPRTRAGAGLPRFSHGDHRGQQCATCHSSRVRHGQLMVRGAADCQRCHHQGPGREQCASCHAADQLRRPLDRQARTFQLAAGGATVTRHVPLDHQRHASVACVRCHSNPISRAPDGADCASCHANHHQATSTCTTCHGTANALGKHRAADHPNCASASCHGARAAGLPNSREACLTCHRAQTQHVPGRACEQCHRVMAPEGR